MKTFTKILTAAAATALLATGCVNEDPAYKNNEPGTPPDPNAKGYLTLADMSMRVVVDTDTETRPDDTSDETAKPQTRTDEAQPDVDTFIIEIRDATGKLALQETYGDLKVSIGEAGRLELPVGGYTMEVRSEEAATTPAAEWEHPIYFGSQEFVIEKNQTTPIDEVVCTLNNIKVTLMCSKDLADQLTADTKSTVTLGETTMTFLKDETRAAYFMPQGETNTLKLHLEGAFADTPDAPVRINKSISGVKAGQWRKITINVLNANEGNVQFQITVENWVYDQKIDVDVMRLYAFAEETIPDEDISDEGSPVVTLDGKDIAQGYTISGSMYDELLGKWTENLKAVVTPEDGATVKSVNLVFESDNADFLAAVDAAGYKNRTVPLWPENEANAPYVVMKEASTSVLTATVKDAGMSGFYQYEGTHTAKFVTVDSKGRTSYTKLNIRVTESGSTESGPGIVWTNKSGSKTYDFDTRYNHIGMEILIGVTSQTGFTGFTVDIISENVLPASELESVGLASHLDLINPGEFQSKLEGFGFPTGAAVSGQKTLSFDISGFMDLLSLLNKEGNCDFRLTVTDASGTNTKTIRLYVTKN